MTKCGSIDIRISYLSLYLLNQLTCQWHVKVYEGKECAIFLIIFFIIYFFFFRLGKIMIWI